MSAFYYHDSIFVDTLEESTAKALNVLSTAIVEGIHTEVIFDPDYVSISYTLKVHALLDDAKSSIFRADEVNEVMNALRVLFKPVSAEWTHCRTEDKKRDGKLRTRTIHLETGKESKVVYVNLWY